MMQEPIDPEWDRKREVDYPTGVVEKFTPWKPYPAGVFIAGFMTPVTILLIVVAAVTNDMVSGVAALIFGAIAVEEAIDAAYHAGLRAESHAEKLRRRG